MERDTEQGERTHQKAVRTQQGFVAWTVWGVEYCPGAWKVDIWERPETVALGERSCFYGGKELLRQKGGAQ